jgi:hypothetical protein
MVIHEAVNAVGWLFSERGHGEKNSETALGRKGGERKEETRKEKEKKL